MYQSMLNVLAVITDNVNMTTDTESSQWYESKAWPTLIATNDYYPFGMAMNGRTSQLAETNAYRYGFNGKELDDWNQADQEPSSGGGPPGPPPAPDDAVVNPGSGTVYDYGFRIYNPRIAKFLSVDPLTKSYPMLTPYQFASNTPIAAIDLDGLEALFRVSGNHWKNEINKAIDDGDIKRASFLAFKAISVTLDDLATQSDKEWATSDGGWEGNSPATTAYNNRFPPGLTVTDNEGNFLFAIKPMVKEPSSWYEGLFSTSKEGGGFVLTTKNGVAGRLGSAREGLPSREINIDLLMAAIGASGSAATNKQILFPGKNVKEVVVGVKQIFDASQIGKDMGYVNPVTNDIASENDTIKCKLCEEGSGGTGYKIKGSSKHVIPTNKDVPYE